MTDSSVIRELFGVEGKVVLVTGGSRGIGLAIAEGFVKAGARVYIASRNAEACDQAAQELSLLGQCFSLPSNVSRLEGCQSLADDLGSRETALHVLINNAGAIWAEKLEGYPESGWDKAFDVNVKGPFFLVQALNTLLLAGASQDDPARIINVGSIDGLHVPTHETYAYSSSKAAVHHLSRHLAAHYAPFNVTVNAIAPGLYKSKMLAATLEERGEESVLEPVPLRRFANSFDVAGTAIYLSSKAGAYVTGAIVPVDGGMATTL
jgi:NAD(P)-dependent dehydrogenase (short-subunit alcohol dehydrogenase family)